MSSNKTLAQKHFLSCSFIHSSEIICQTFEKISHFPESLVMSTFVYEDGLGNFVGENGEEAVITQMGVDDETYPLDSVTNYDQYIDLKSSEK
ncbi:hypothetical protein RO3G_04081 [Rhizopus delemar RA 99-880]|uniref:Uncharacterized protein n=1 Tax=Rhizopus delemar (strain RA 99-880 / ATCC MYA-4621 / FGSC 9543 / NRRL 43880) TaxID=246409 RepID=I1BT46_RHIO9|nr:hypothetical protein RO3G_04081 [Rhizopus delemar RA 99-880]|eukprot:EIE79376.1 hypothetical protein RO3G_04081 [Rhizopus delemar RA 99-880]